MSEQGKVVSFRLSPEEIEAVGKKAFKCPTCRQSVENTNTIIRLLIRKQLGMDIVKPNGDE
jgi:hypothetical protein